MNYFTKCGLSEDDLGEYHIVNKLDKVEHYYYFQEFEASEHPINYTFVVDDIENTGLYYFEMMAVVFLKIYDNRDPEPFAYLYAT